MKRSATYPYYQAFGLEKDQKADDDGLKVDGADNAVLLRIMPPRPAKKSTDSSDVEKLFVSLPPILYIT